MVPTLLNAANLQHVLILDFVSTYQIQHITFSTLEIRGRDREGNWRCPSYKTRQSLALELGLPPLLCGLEEGNQGTGAKFTLPKTSGILCWSTLEKLSRNSCNSHPLPSPASSRACPGPDMTSITLVSASFLNGTLVLFYQKKLYFVDQENACATRNRNVCVPRQGFPPPKFRLILEQSHSGIILPGTLLAQVPTARMQFR